MPNPEHAFLVSFVILMRKWRRFLIINIGVFTLAALVISLLLPKSYRAEAKILTSSGDIAALGLSGLVSDLPFKGLGLLPKSDETLRYLAILNSRTLLMRIAEKFDLQKRYETADWQKTLRALQGNCKFDVNIDESISIHVWDKEPEFAAKMANSFVEMLDSLNIALRLEKAKSDREFLQTRLEENKRDLAQAELNLRDYQEKFGVIEVKEQTKVAIQTIAELEAQILLKETELRYKSNYLSPDHLDIQNLKTEIREIKKSLNEIQYGSNGDDASGNPSFLMTGKDVPELAMNYLRAWRDVEIQNAIHKILTQQFEQAKIMEAKQTPTLQVLDWAVPPIYKDRPKRSLIVLGAFFFSAVLSIFFIFAVEKWRTLKTIQQ